MLSARSGRGVSRAALAVALVVFVPASVSASVLMLQHAGAGGGTLAGQPFALSDFVITAYSDTNNRQPLSGGWFIDHTSASVAIAGLGTYDFVTGTRTFVNYSLVGFSRAGANGVDLFNGPLDPAFSSWDMLSSIGPITGTGGLLQWTNSPQINTSGGILIFDNASVANATFTALIPEPATLGLLATSLLGLRRRR
jgi:hypothetical protein